MRPIDQIGHLKGREPLLEMAGARPGVPSTPVPRTASLDGYRYDINELRGKLLTVVKNNMFDKDGSPEAWCRRVLAECQEQLAPLFEHNSNEMAFLDALYEEGRIDVSSLQGDPMVKHAIENFPALQWKALNIRNHKAGLLRS